MSRKCLSLLMFLICVLVFAWIFLKNRERYVEKEMVIAPVLEVTKTVEKVYPILEFKQRINKKPFGIYITSANSPVQPERFSGFHTGVDVEYSDMEGEVKVLAVCDGEIVFSKWVSGYGGTVVLKCQNNYIIYGHLKMSSINKKLKVSKGEQLAVLGENKTRETDFERKHLHFGIHKGSIDLRGYVQNQEELNEWVDPLSNLIVF